MSEYQPTNNDENTPFRLSLEDTVQGKESTISNFKNDSRYIVRAEPLSEKKDNKLHRQALKDFARISGLNVPDYWDVIGEFNEKKVTYKVTKKINGLPLSEYFDKPDNRINQTEIVRLIHSIVHYIGYVSKNNLTTIGDLRPDQFMYGKQEGDSDDQFYMVDLDNFTVEKSDPLYTRDVLKFCYQAISKLPPNRLFTPVLLEMIQLLDDTIERYEEYRNQLLILKPYILNQIKKNA